MIKAELVYNPYLGETDISFNGQSPKINSQVEKYQGEILNDWIDKIPKIFHDEMNGYGFELDFSGTELDYRNLQASFERLGVSHDDVQIFFKNELESRPVKVDRIEKLLDWLKNNPNRNFDYDAFKKGKSGLLDDLYIYKILQGDGIDPEALKDNDISVEIINDTRELDETNLTYTPILVYITETSQKLLKSNVHYLKSRKDIKMNQVFFYIDEKLNHEAVSRVIRDLGVVNPQIISTIYDDKVKEYFELYPITDYIYQTLEITRKITDYLKTRLNELNRNNQISEEKANSSISESDSKIQALKVIDNAFINRDNIDVPDSFRKAKNKLIKSITGWRNKKTVITQEEEARAVTQEFECMFVKAYEEYWNAINVALIRAEEDLKGKYQSMYSKGGIDANYRPNVALTSKIPSFVAPAIKDTLMTIKEEKYVLPKEGIIDQVFKANEANRFMEKVTNYYYKNWRDYVAKKASDMADEDIRIRCALIKQYSDELAGAFQKHISGLLEAEIKKKSAEMNQLSEADRQLQMDTDWLNTFVEQISAIERG